MADLRISDAPLLPQDQITGAIKVPTGGEGNYAIQLSDLAWYVVNKENLTDIVYVDTAVSNVNSALQTHVADKANPHQVTKAQVGLDQVDNTADLDKPVSNATRSAIIAATTDMATKTYVSQQDSLKADISYVDTKVGAVSGGYFAAVDTLASLQAKTGMTTGQVAKVMSDPTASKNGDYYYNGTAWVKGYSSAQESRDYANANYNFNSQAIASGVSLDALTTEGFYFKNGSGDITDALNYPVKHAGTLRVSTNKNNAVTQVYIPFINGDMYVRSSQGSGVWTAWQKVKTGLGTSDVLEWQKIGASSKIIFDSATKVLSITGTILAPYTNNTAGRIKITDVTIQFANAYEIAYLDLKALGTTADITADNQAQFIKVSTYADGTNGYRAKPNQVPLFKYHAAENYVLPASGMLSFSNSSVSTASSADTFYFNKQATTSYIYLPTSSGKLVRVKLYRQKKAFDGTSPDSQSDTWRFADVYETDASYTAQRYIVSNGEWDTAIQVQGATDHVGGVHGDELLTDAYFLIDGIYYAQDTVFAGAVEELTLIQKSNIYLQNTQTILAERTKVSTINKNGIRTEQKLVFKQASVLDKAWVTMLPIKRTVNDDGTGGNITDTGVRSSNSYAVEDISASGFAHVYNNTKAGDTFVISGKTSGISAKVTMQTLDVPASQNYIANASLYNKLYVSAISLTNTYTTSINETWQIVTDIAFNIR